MTKALTAPSTVIGPIVLSAAAIVGPTPEESCPPTLVALLTRTDGPVELARVSTPSGDPGSWEIAWWDLPDIAQMVPTVDTHDMVVHVLGVVTTELTSRGFDQLSQALRCNYDEICAEIVPRLHELLRRYQDALHG